MADQNILWIELVASGPLFLNAILESKFISLAKPKIA
jgi:hypothetical protein